MVLNGSLYLPFCYFTLYSLRLFLSQLSVFKSRLMWFLFSSKNPTPRGLAVFTALNVVLFFVLSGIILKLSLPEGLDWMVLLLLGFIVGIVSYFTFIQALKRFIYRKIKLIYKSIHRLKMPRDRWNKKLDLRNHIIDEVEREVMTWANRHQQEIADLKKMEEYRRDFFGNVSHELKTPIFNIQGYLYTLLDGGIDDPAVNIKYLQKAVDNVERIGNIVQDLEIISRLEADETELDFSRFSLYELAKEVLEDLQIKAEKRQIELKFKDGARKPFVVYADKETIRQVLINLVTNSIKYGREQGCTQIIFYDLGEQILTEVSDNGVGVDEEHLPRLFERFYRADKGRSRQSGGTGLGLAIVKHIIEAHQQNINVRSTVGIGTTFGFTLEKADK